MAYQVIPAKDRMVATNGSFVMKDGDIITSADSPAYMPRGAYEILVVEATVFDTIEAQFLDSDGNLSGVPINVTDAGTVDCPGFLAGADEWPAGTQFFARLGSTYVITFIEIVTGKVVVYAL